MRVRIVQENGTPLRAMCRRAAIGAVFAVIGAFAICLLSASALAAKPPCGGDHCVGVADLRAGAGTARPWHFRRTVGERTVEISVGWGACSRKPAPTIEGKVTRRPGQAVITVFVEVPSPPPDTPCQRLRLKRNIRVQIGTPVDQLKLYDGSFSPPKLRWSGTRS
jgi:hypothetical protein